MLINKKVVVIVVVVAVVVLTAYRVWKCLQAQDHELAHHELYLHSDVTADVDGKLPVIWSHGVTAAAYKQYTERIKYNFISTLDCLF